MATAQKRAAETWRYVLAEDRPLPPEQQSTFVLRPLTQLERADVHDNMSRTHFPPGGGRMVVKRDHRLAAELCLSHIEAVENFPAGQPAAWPPGLAERTAYLEQLDDAWVQELGNEIWAYSTIGPTEKNS